MEKNGKFKFQEQQLAFLTMSQEHNIQLCDGAKEEMSSEKVAPRKTISGTSWRKLNWEQSKCSDDFL